MRKPFFTLQKTLRRLFTEIRHGRIRESRKDAVRDKKTAGEKKNFLKKEAHIGSRAVYGSRNSDGKTQNLILQKSGR